MKITMTNAEAMNLFNVLSNLNMTGSGKFLYTIAKNRALLKPKIEKLQEDAQSYAKNSPQFKEFQTKVDDLLKQFAVDKDGKPNVRQSADGSMMTRIVPADKQNLYMLAREALEAEYKDLLVGMQLHQDEFTAKLKQEDEFELRTLTLKDLPEGSLNTQHMNQIFIFVDDEKEKGEVVPLREVKKDEVGQK